ncbi:ABC transporter substrate-binding protein [Desulfovibrio psychrotolerans]|uniref:ABC transporter substrate-binding protein n=1 Tax=Desulfovibrio psychrotolerans TaxID=415242 RepID=A0A7J0BTX7_9BACT|nr:ABC transporter substrate-binding protein [Desulfovibrio psychrotolerans]GFM37169.1 ABC transporter substrate-binding protein [Desulfovibrio psychrotolerans]
MNMLKRITELAVVLLLLAVVAGCSDEKEDSLARVKKAGEISFAMSGGYPPFNFYDAENRLTGFDVDVAEEVARRMGVALRPVTTEWSGIIEGLRAGTYDGILGSMAVTESRQRVVNFSIPYYYSGAQVMVRTGDDGATGPVTDVAQLEGKTIGVVTGTTFEEDAKGLKAGEVRLYKDDTQTLMELGNGVVDAVITDRVVGVNAMNAGRFKVTMLGGPLRSENIAVAINKADDTLLAEVNTVLKAMHDDGTLAGLSRKWLGVDITTR